MRWVVVAVAPIAALSGCRGKPHPIYEYGPTVTITSGDAPAAAVTTSTLPARPSSWRRGEKQ